MPDIGGGFFGLNAMATFVKDSSALNNIATAFVNAAIWGPWKSAIRHR